MTVKEKLKEAKKPRKRNKEKDDAYAILYYENNKETITIKKKIYRDAHKKEISDYNKEYYKKNADEIKAEHLIYNKENKDKLHAYYEEHKEEKAVYSAKWYLENKDVRRTWNNENRHKRKASEAKRRALKMERTVGNIEDIKEIYRKAEEEEGIICYICGKVIGIGDRHVDHVIPLSRGGMHTADNLKITHSLCNMKKHDKTPEEMEIYDRK